MFNTKISNNFDFQKVFLSDFFLLGPLSFFSLFQPSNERKSGFDDDRKSLFSHLARLLCTHMILHDVDDELCTLLSEYVVRRCQKCRRCLKAVEKRGKKGF